MNIVIIRRNILIVTGMLLLNAIYRCWSRVMGADEISFYSYVVVNLIWADTVRRIAAPVVNYYEEEVRKNDS